MVSNPKVKIGLIVEAHFRASNRRRSDSLKVAIQMATSAMEIVTEYLEDCACWNWIIERKIISHPQDYVKAFELCQV